MLQVAEAEEKTAGGLLLTEATKDKPSIGTVSFSILLLFETTVYLKSNTSKRGQCYIVRRESHRNCKNVMWAVLKKIKTMDGLWW